MPPLYCRVLKVLAPHTFWSFKLNQTKKQKAEGQPNLKEVKKERKYARPWHELELDGNMQISSVVTLGKLHKSSSQNKLQDLQHNQGIKDTALVDTGTGKIGNTVFFFPFS